MKSFFYSFIAAFIFLEIFLMGIFFDDEITSHEFFIYEFLSIMAFNYYVNFSLKTEDFDENIRLNIDIIFKYLIILFKTPSFFFNYFINISKKIFAFLIHYKYKLLLNTIKILIKKYTSNSFIWWRPLFKKTSYFGYYRSNRSKWIKK